MATRFTKGEAALLAGAASRKGVAVREWAREVLLDASQSTQIESALFTEMVALRMLLNNVLRELAQGKVMTDKAYAQIINEVRTSKHEAARDLLAQYQPAKEVE